MNHVQFLYYFFYFIVVGFAVHVVLIALVVIAYRATKIKSLIPMVVSNTIGMAYIVAACFRQFYTTPVSTVPLMLTCAAFYTLEVVIGVWATAVFLRTVSNVVAAKNGLDPLSARE